MFSTQLTSVRVVLFVIFIAAREIYALNCITCISIDCSEDGDPMCAEILKQLQKKLSPYYYFNTKAKLTTCPLIEDIAEWTIMQIEAEKCPALKANQATCALGRMQIRTEAGQRTNYATIMGCAKLDLLRRVSSAKKNGKCDSFSTTIKGDKSGPVWELEIEHCDDSSTFCNDQDHCINRKLSLAKEFYPKDSISWIWIAAIKWAIGLTIIMLLALSAKFLCNCYGTHPMLRHLRNNRNEHVEN